MSASIDSLRAGTHDLDGYLGAIREFLAEDGTHGCRERRAVDLSDGRRGERRVVERGEELVGVLAELLADDLADRGDGQRRDRVLKLLHLEHDLRREEVGTHRHELAELDERRTEFLESDPQLARKRGLANVTRGESETCARAGTQCGASKDAP